jgi:ribose 5-phosphate isomerase B
MKIAIGCDHRGYDLKQKIMEYLPGIGHTFQDFGCYSTDSVDYPDIAKKVADVVVSESFKRGILICGTGMGMSIAANKIKGIRAALCYDAFAASRARKHNDANVLCLKGEDKESSSSLEIVKIFLSTEFEGGRHTRRLEKITTLETS